MADNFSIDTQVGLKANRRTIASDETDNVHTIRTSLSSGGSPISSENPLPVGDADVLAQLVATNTALVTELQKLSLLLVDCVQGPLFQITSQLELITDTVFTPEDVEDRDAYY